MDIDGPGVGEGGSGNAQRCFPQMGTLVYKFKAPTAISMRSKARERVCESERTSNESRSSCLWGSRNSSELAKCCSPILSHAQPPLCWCRAPRPREIADCSRALLLRNTTNTDVKCRQKCAAAIRLMHVLHPQHEGGGVRRCTGMRACECFCVKCTCVWSGADGSARRRAPQSDTTAS